MNQQILTRIHNGNGSAIGAKEPPAARHVQETSRLNCEVSGQQQEPTERAAQPASQESPSFRGRMSSGIFFDIPTLPD